MSNNNLLKESSKLSALKISNLLEDESLTKINKEKDLDILKELYFIYFQSDKAKLNKATLARITSLGGTV